METCSLSHFRTHLTASERQLKMWILLRISFFRIAENIPSKADKCITKNKRAVHFGVELCEIHTFPMKRKVDGVLYLLIYYYLYN